MNSLTNQLSKVSIDDTHDTTKTSGKGVEYTVNQSLATADLNLGYFTTVNLNFFQLWAMFGRDPIFYRNEKCKYEWKIQSSDGVIFSVYDWNNSKSLLETTEWHIGSNGKSRENKRFMAHLGKALCCYNEFYTCMERGVFESRNEEAQNCMNVLRGEIQSKLLEFAGK